MSQHNSWQRLWALLIAAIAVGVPGLARADVQACVDQHSQGQLLRDQSRFREARGAFVGCADPACPDAIRAECASLLSELERAMPTVVLAARDEQRRDLVDVHVELDGQPLEAALSGRAIALDPGPHRFRFVARDGRTREIDAIALEWVKGRPIEVQFEATATPASAQPHTLARTPGIDSASTPARIPTLTYVFGGIGLGAVAGFGYFAWAGKSERKELAETCSPLCTGEQLSPVRSKYLLADILLGVGVASLGAGAYFFFSSPDGLPEPAEGRGLVIGVRSTL